MQYGKMSIQDFEAFYPGVNRRTLQRDIKEMIDKLVSAEGATNQLVYHLEGRLGGGETCDKLATKLATF